MVFDADLLLTPQGVLSGGRDTSAEFWGNADYTLNVDTGKLGLWPGGFFKIYAGSSFGESLFDDSGTLVPVERLLADFQPNEPSTTRMQATFMQFLSPKFGVLAGKIFTLVDDTGAFAGNFGTQFMNTALAIPMSLALVPISAYGGGVIALPWEGVVLSARRSIPAGPEEQRHHRRLRRRCHGARHRPVAVKPFGSKGTRRSGSCGATRTPCR